MKKGMKSSLCFLVWAILLVVYIVISNFIPQLINDAVKIIFIIVFFAALLSGLYYRKKEKEAALQKEIEDNLQSRKPHI